MAAIDNPLEIAEVVEIVLRFLPGRCVSVAAQVCHLWCETVERIRRSRRKCAVYLSPVGSSFSEFSKEALDFIRQQQVEPRALILFSGQLPSSSASFVNNFLQSVRSCLPVNCPLIGCTGLGVIGSDERRRGQPREIENTAGLSLLMFPRCDGLEIRDFHIPLRNKYKRISGVKSFLPDMNLPVQLVIVLAHPLSLGKLTRLTMALRSKYGDDVVIVGGYSDSYLFYNTEVTTREIIGLVLAGNLQSSSVIITGGTKMESTDNLYDSIHRLDSSSVPKEDSFSLMFSCFSRGIMTYGYENAQSLAFNDTFPTNPLVGFFGTAAFGCDRENLKARGLKPGGRDFLHVDATVLCLTSLAL